MPKVYLGISSFETYEAMVLALTKIQIIELKLYALGHVSPPSSYIILFVLSDHVFIPANPAVVLYLFIERGCIPLCPELYDVCTDSIPAFCPELCPLSTGSIPNSVSSSVLNFFDLIANAAKKEAPENTTPICHTLFILST